PYLVASDNRNTRSAKQGLIGVPARVSSDITVVELTR
ncbi:MAG: hypothetical protein H6Q52_3664, partial [Deltaproteobacteria bacterium]|nr:hypothetical protein [Deltaproteobacteria bacterium]